MQKTISLSIPFGIPNNGFSLRWGEVYEAGFDGIVNVGGGGPVRVTEGWNVYWELIVGSVTNSLRSTLLHWKIDGGKFNHQERTTTVYVPQKNSQFSHTALTEEMQYPGGKKGTRKISEPDLEKGEGSIWIPGAYPTSSSTSECNSRFPRTFKL